MAWSRHHPGHDEPRVPRAVRQFVWMRDNAECQLRMPVCTDEAEQLDHIIGVAEFDGRYDDPENLQCVCAACHDVKTKAQRYPLRVLGRKPERHPGIRR